MIVSKELELQLKREVYSKSYYEFFKFCFKILFPSEDYVDTFHIKYLCDYLQNEHERILRKEDKKKDVIINIPPRTSKSLICSVCFLPWVWITNPSAQFITVSFDDQLSLTNAGYSRDIIRSEEYQELFGHIYQVRKDRDSKGLFMNDKGGVRLSKTTGQNITGHKGLYIILDDPQSAESARNENERNRVIRYFTENLFNRLTPANLGLRLLVQQRLHQEDLSGYLMTNSGDSYHHICLPAEASSLINPPELVKYYKDGLLDKNRLGPWILKQFKSTLLTAYSGQYEQNPVPGEGGIFKKDWFSIIEPVGLQRNKDTEPIHFFIDSAYTEKQTNDPSAIVTCYRSGNYLYILDVQELWLEFPELITFIKNYVSRFQYSVGSKIWIEPKASGKSIAQQLRAQTMLNVVEMKSPTDSKETRAHAVAPIVHAQRVKLIKGPYVEKFMDQVTTFPFSTHKDMTDAFVYSLIELMMSDGNPDFLFL